ncbi:MAG: O-methyltransferase [Phycisphaeraceae bacterium]|nr:O-methyltransferase [Phycisphaeraceae bacterium]
MNNAEEQRERTAAYLSDVFGAAAEGAVAEVLKAHAVRAAEAGLPPIAISADVGRLLSIFARLATRSPASTGRIVEVGTLGGYSGIWMARALPAGGCLLTVERSSKHAEFAARQFAQAGLADRVEIVLGTALDCLPALVSRLGPASVDMIFLDADKQEYPDYVRLLKPVLRSGGVLAADNALGSDRWWITQPTDALAPEVRPMQAAADRFNRLMAADADFETGCIVNRQGVLVAVRR